MENVGFGDTALMSHASIKRLSNININIKFGDYSLENHIFQDVQFTVAKINRLFYYFFQIWFASSGREKYKLSADV